MIYLFHNGDLTIGLKDMRQRPRDSTQYIINFRQASRRQGRLGATICVALILFITLYVPTPAAEPPLALDVPLVPVGSPGSALLSGCAIVVRLVYSGETCEARVEQTYKLRNQDRAKASSVRVGLPSKVGEQHVSPEATLRDGQAVLPALGPGPAHSVTWEVKLGRDEIKALTLSYAYPIRYKHLIPWRCEMPLLSAWGKIESARLELVMPQYTTDDAFIVLEPSSTSFNNRALVWEYENMNSLPRHEVLILSPNTWRQVGELRAQGAHRLLSRLYAAIQEEAQKNRLALPDLWDQIIGELQAAIAENPNDVAARLDLAHEYQMRIKIAPALRLNYLLLAAQELGAVYRLQPTNAQVANELSLLYYEAAMAANASGDPAGALAYLQKAEEVPGAQLPQEREKREELSLRWALSMAERGQASQAILRVEHLLSPQTKDALLRYAPPFLSAHTEIALKPGERIVRYHVQLYPPSAPRTVARLQELAARAKAVESCQADLELGAVTCALNLRVGYESVPQLRARGAALAGALSADEDLLAALLAAPWHTGLDVYLVERGMLSERYLYAERIDLRPLHTAWQQQSQFTRWRLIELRSTPAADERARLGHQLAELALDEQGQFWEQLPAGTYWTFALEYPNSTVEVPGWLVSWGQARRLSFSHRVYHWRRILPLTAAGLGTFGLLLLALALGKR